MFLNKSKKEKLDKLIKECKIIPTTGYSYDNLICPKENIEKFIKGISALNIRIPYNAWWCKVTEGHEPCGGGGPVDKENNCWYSESWEGEDIGVFKSNEELLNYLINDWEKDKNYKECYVPAFWLKVPKSWRLDR